MKSFNMNIIGKNMLMTAELIKVMKLLEENNIDAIAFKGPTLSQMAYGDVVSRQYSDLDILVQKTDIYKIYDLLKNSYTRNLNLTNSQEDSWFKYAHDLGLRSQNGIHIEFHWRMLDSDHPINLQDINFFNYKALTMINNTQIPTISNELLLIYLCIHGSKHMYERIEWIVDIDKFIKTQTIDWDLISTLLKDKNYTQFVYLGLHLAKQLFNTPIANIDNKNIVAIENHICNLWNNSKKFDNKTNLKFMLQLFTSTKDKLAYLHKIYFKPTFNEYWYITFPKPLYFLYYPLRQYLLLKKHIIDKKQSKN
jgi:hypothetical protein